MLLLLHFYLIFSVPSGANIFITAGGSIKIGDFGLCVQMKNTKTRPEEIKGTAGTPGNAISKLYKISYTVLFVF